MPSGAKNFERNLPPRKPAKAVYSARLLRLTIAYAEKQAITTSILSIQIAFVKLHAHKWKNVRLLKICNVSKCNNKTCQQQKKRINAINLLTIFRKWQAFVDLAFAPVERQVFSFLVGVLRYLRTSIAAHVSLSTMSTTSKSNIQYGNQKFRQYNVSFLLANFREVRSIVRFTFADKPNFLPNVDVDSKQKQKLLAAIIILRRFMARSDDGITEARLLSASNSIEIIA